MHDRHAHTVSGRSPEPAPIFPSRPCSLMQKPANDPQGKGRTHATVSSIAWLGTLRSVYARHCGDRCIHVRGRRLGVPRIERARSNCGAF